MKGGVRDRLRAWMKEHPNACAYSLDAIAQELGCTRERVRQIMPDFTQNSRPARHAAYLARVQAFIDEHPEALLPRAVPLRDTCRELRTSEKTFTAALRELGYPTRGEIQASQAQHRSRAWWRTIMRWDICRHCGKRFGVTRARQRNINCGLVKYRTCGIQCGIALRGEAADYDESTKVSLT